MWKTFKTSIMAGVCIGLGGLIFMKVGGIIGAVMFAFGLLCVLLMLFICLMLITTYC